MKHLDLSPSNSLLSLYFKYWFCHQKHALYTMLHNRLVQKCLRYLGYITTLLISLHRVNIVLYLSTEQLDVCIFLIARGRTRPQVDIGQTSFSDKKDFFFLHSWRPNPSYGVVPYILCYCCKCWRKNRVRQQLSPAAD